LPFEVSEREGSAETTSCESGGRMLSLPEDLFALLEPLAPLCSRRVWRSGPVLLVVGAILAPGRRTLGLGQTRRFQNSHRVLSRAVWSSRRAT
jgi:hypothetical protein